MLLRLPHLAAGCLSLTLFLSVTARADLTVRLPGEKAPPPPARKADGAPNAVAKAATTRVLTPPLASRSRPRQLGVARRGSVPVLPDADGTLTPGGLEMPQPAGQAVPTGAPIPVNARLGRLTATADLHRLPDPQSPWLGKLGRSQQVAVVSQWNGWYAIVMGDGSQAYLPKSKVELLPYQVKSVVPAAAAPEGKGGSVQGLFQGASPLAQRVIAEALRYRELGTPYVWGGNTERGLDCSGLVRNCFLASGISLPRTAGLQQRHGYDVPFDQLQPGDRLYFSVRRANDHTGLYLGNGYFIHASRGRGRVDIDHLSQRLYHRSLTSARRL